MELTIVGCSGSVSGPDSTASCYLVRAPYEGRTYALVLDLGPGSFGQLYRYLDPAQLDAIGLSHLHPDHCLDLTGCYVAGTYSATAPWPQIALLGPAGTLARVAAAYEVPGSAEQPDLAARFDERCWARTQELGPFRVDTIAARHPVEAYSLRITGPAGESLVYTGDTGPNPALAEFSAAADLLLAEAAFSDAADNPVGPPSVRPRRCAAGHDGRGRAARADPHPALDRVGADTRRRAAALRRTDPAGGAGPAAHDLTDGRWIRRPFSSTMPPGELGQAT